MNKKYPTHLPISKRLRIYFVNFVFNGFMGMTLFILFVWFVLPTTFFFEYESVEPVVVPVDITEESIKMQSNILSNRTSGNLHWNDVLRCNYDLDPEGYFEYVGQSDTSVNTTKIFSELYIAPWVYTGTMPDREALCQMNSTITRYVFDYIPKRQFVQSQMFLIQ